MLLPPEGAVSGCRRPGATDMKPATVETLVWVLMYGGLLGVGLGLALQRTEPAFGWTLIVAGGVLAVAGVVLIYVRSRMKDDQ